MERARHDYGVVILEIDGELAEYELDARRHDEERERIRESGTAGSRRTRSPSRSATGRARSTCSTSIRAYGVILDWGTGELLPRTTEGFRAMLHRRMVPHWENGGN